MAFCPGCGVLSVGNIKRAKHGPEWHIQQDLIRFMRARHWMVERMIGNAFQTGIPDLYCRHAQWGERWVDVKQSRAYSFTKAQRFKWPIWEHYKAGIWILTAATQEQYDLLFAPPNWRDYWKPSYGDFPDIDKLLLELDDIDEDWLDDAD